MKTLKIAILITLLSTTSTFSEIMMLKAKNGVEKNFDVVAVSQQNIRYKDRGTFKTVPISLVDEESLLLNKKISNAINESEKMRNEYLNGVKKSSSSSNNAVTSRSSSFGGGGNIYNPFGGYISKSDFESVKNQTKNITGKIKSINTKGTEVTLSVKGKDPKNPIKEIYSDWVVINLPSERLNVGNSVSIKIAPTIKRNVYICLNDKETFDSAIENIFIPIEYKGDPRANAPFDSKEKYDPFSPKSKDPFAR